MVEKAVGDHHRDGMSWLLRFLRDDRCEAGRDIRALCALSATSSGSRASSKDDGMDDG